MHDSNCPFCAIAQGEDGSVNLIHASPNWIAFLPDCPATPGHTLIIPRCHIPDLLHLEPATGGMLMEAAVRLSHAIERALKPEGMNLIASSGAVAEQSVFHFHIHLVPRWDDDNIGQIWPAKRPTSKGKLIQVAESIGSQFNSQGTPNSNS